MAAVTGPGAWYGARCEAPRMTRSRESAIPDAACAACQGGAAVSSDPAMTSVGTFTELSEGHRSIPAIASPQPA